MADQGNESNEQQGGTETETTDYKSLWEQAKADAEKWKTQARKNESRAKSNAGLNNRRKYAPHSAFGCGTGPPSPSWAW